MSRKGASYVVLATPPPVTILVDSRIRLFLEALPEDVVSEIRSTFTHENPQHQLKRMMGIPAWSEPRTYKTFSEDEGMISVPRGGMARIRKILEDAGLERNVQDRRTNGRVVKAGFIPPTNVTLRDYQEQMIAAAIRRENCLLRAGTGSGKTTAAIALASRLGLYTLVIVWSGNLFDQWIERIEKELGIPESEIGIIRGSKCSLKPITVAMQQTLAAREELVAKHGEVFGVVICDEVQRFAAKTLFDAVDSWPAKYRVGISADESRKDKKEFLIYDLFGVVAADIKREDLVKDGNVLEVVIHVIPTEFRADWYKDTHDFNMLLETMRADEKRNELVLEYVLEEAIECKNQVMILSHRREHCEYLNGKLKATGLTSGLMLGGEGSSDEFAVTKRGLDTGAIMIGVGTTQAIAQGLDIPRIGRMAVSTPLAANKQLFGQARGRVCRPAEGKKDAILYYFWDQHVYGLKHLENLVAWNKVVLVKDGTSWTPGREYLKKARTADKAKVDFLDEDEA